MRPITPGLERGIRLEILLVPLMILLPLVAGIALLWMGIAEGQVRLVVLGIVVWGGNALFDVLMLRAIRRAVAAGREA